MDVLSGLITTPYAFHGLIVGAVLLFALLVFSFGFKSAVEPPFDKLSDDRRAVGKKKKIKEKKAQSNGHATAVSDASSGKKSEVKTPKKEEKKEVEKSPSKDKQKQEKKSPAKNTLKETKTANKENKAGDASKKVKGKGKENVEVTAKNKKNKAVDEKPKDFDDGEWEQAVSRKDKKNKKTALEEILPQKNDKKKDKKKAKEEEGVLISSTEPVVEEKAVPDFVEIIESARTVEIETVIADPEPEKVQNLIAEPAEATEEAKPKKPKAKKKPAPPPPEQASPSPAKTQTSPKVDKPSKGPAPQPPAAPVAEPAPVASPKPQRTEKKKAREPSPEPVAVAAPELEVVAPESSNVAFDELGDTWKEAKAPKKSSKKKTRKD